MTSEGGWSGIVEGERGGEPRPVSTVSRLRSSTAVSESKPRSRNARSASTALELPCPSTAAACARTTSTSSSRCPAGSSPASRPARPPPFGAAAGLASLGTRPASTAGSVPALASQPARLCRTWLPPPPGPARLRPRRTVQTPAEDSGAIPARRTGHVGLARCPVMPTPAPRIPRPATARLPLPARQAASASRNALAAA